MIPVRAPEPPAQSSPAARSPNSWWIYAICFCMFADQNLYLSSLLRFPETDELEYLHSITAGKTNKMQWNTQGFPLSDSSMHTHFSLYLSMYFWSLLSSPALWHAWTSRSSPVQGCMPMKTFTPPSGYGLGAHLPSFSCNIRTKSVAMLTSSGLVKAWGAWCSQRHVIDWQQFHCGCTNWNLDSGSTES